MSAAAAPAQGAPTPASKPAAPQQLSGLALYSRFAFAGAVCCSITHGAVTPLDVYVPTLDVFDISS